MHKELPLTDVHTLRARARANIEEGAVTTGYAADRATVLRLLDESLATELVCVLRYRRHHFMARGIHSQSVAQEFLDHSNEEQGHADQIAERIVQLGGSPDFAPNGLAGRSHAEYVAGDTLAGMIREDLVAERILAVEEQHADELADLLVAFPADAAEEAHSGRRRHG